MNNYYGSYGNYSHWHRTEEEDLKLKDIPKVITGGFKFFFWCKFLYLVGVFHLLTGLLITDEERNDQMQANKIVNAFLTQKLHEADSMMKHDGGYSPYAYFSMIHRLYELEDSVGRGMGADGSLFQIQELMHKSLRSGVYTNDDLDKAREWKEKLPKKVFAKKKYPPHVCSKHIHHITWSTLPQWLWHVYKQMFLYVIFLLLIWVYQRKDSPTLSLRSPLSFFLFVLFHPIYIGIILVRTWRREWRGFSAEVELRKRKKNIFEKLSEEERLTIRAFARSTKTFKEFVQWADTFSSRRHIAFFAVVAVIIGSIGNRLQAQTASSQGATVCVVEKTTHADCISVDDDVGTVSTAKALLFELLEWMPPDLLRSLARKKGIHFLLSGGYVEIREPVPIGC